jgi:hypothetical protein
MGLVRLDASPCAVYATQRSRNCEKGPLDVWFANVHIVSSHVAASHLEHCAVTLSVDSSHMALASDGPPFGDRYARGPWMAMVCYRDN